MASGLTWWEAEALARQGHAIRRHDERKWFWMVAPRVWKTRFSSGSQVVERVVTASDFTVAHFAATDWTNEGWSSLTEVEIPGAGGGDGTGGSTPEALPDGSSPLVLYGVEYAGSLAKPVRLTVNGLKEYL